MVLCRELAFQIADQFRAFGKGVNVRDVVIVGGMGMPLSLADSIMQGCVISIYLCADMMKQSLSLVKQPHVVIATPGRLADHLRNTDTFSLKKVKFLVSLQDVKCHMMSCDVM